MKRIQDLYHVIVISICLFSASLFLTGCGEDDKGDYTGVGKLISDRNKARHKTTPSESPDSDDDTLYTEDLPQTDSSSKKKRSGLTFEENVKIISEKSGKTIARATAYLDKSGRIINIRLKKRR